MENDFEDFVDDNRESFEQQKPPAEVWLKLQPKLEEYHRKKKVFALRRFWYSTTAAVIIITVVTLAVYLPHKKNDTSEIAAGKAKPATGIAHAKPKSDTGEGQPAIAIKTPAVKNYANEAGVGEKKYISALLVYTKQVEAGKAQLAMLQKQKPALFTDFNQSIDELSTIYVQLKSSLPVSINRQKVLQAMIANLLMQQVILNNQIQLINNVTANGDKNDKGDSKI